MKSEIKREGERAIVGNAKTPEDKRAGGIFLRPEEPQEENQTSELFIKGLRSI